VGNVGTKTATLKRYGEKSENHGTYFRLLLLFSVNVSLRSLSEGGVAELFSFLGRAAGMAGEMGVG